MKKKIISILLCTAMLFSLSFSGSSAIFAAETADGRDGGTPSAETAAAVLDIDGMKIKERVYDGTTQVEIEYVLFLDQSGNSVSLTKGVDYTVSGVLDDPDAGNDKFLTATVTMLNPNYTLSSASDRGIVNIAQAKPSAGVTFTEITSAGKTLKDANLQGTSTTGGTFAWTLNESTSVERGKAYEWTFIPNDRTNYQEVRGSVVLWKAPGSGGSGEGSGTVGGETGEGGQGSGSEGNGGQGGGETGGSGDAAVDAQKPTVEFNRQQCDVFLSDDGTSLTIQVKEGYQITEILVNGVSKGAADQVTGLKSGDKVVVNTAKKTDEPADPSSKDKIIQGVQNTKIQITKTVSNKSGIRICFKKSKGYSVDYYEVFRKTGKSGKFGKKAFYQTRKGGAAGEYKNTKSLKKGTRYYYKVRGVRVIDGKKYYTQWSKTFYRTAK